MNDMKSVIYIRTSTKSQKIDIQLSPLLSLAKRSEYEIVDIIKDEGVSGKTLGASRNGMNKLLKMVQRKEIDVILSYSVDRLGRKLSDIITLTETLNEKGVGLIVYKNGIDTTTTYGKHLLSFFGLIAEMERDFINSRSREGQEIARSKGKQIGRSKISKRNIEKIIELREKNFSMGQIATELSLSKGTIHKYLT
ncbi:MAG: resolvase [Flavobacteriaceae bacterium]|jgi:DNA invertase Pin-like site-specific DNA recombinase|nr:resolvase [Flavobacteriaceae bacterium]|tara:strand:- start:1883 stop:2467 length:585 start_codon:yes stop_codon:yes gene_type:complete